MTEINVFILTQYYGNKGNVQGYYDDLLWCEFKNYIDVQLHQSFFKCES